MKKIFGVLTLTLALNFVAAAGTVGWLWKSGKLDRAKVMVIKEILFPKPDPAPADAASPTTEPTTQPFLHLDALLEQHAGKRAGEQVEVIQQTFDAQSAMLDRRRRELDALAAQVATEQKKLADASGALDADRRRFEEQEGQAQTVAADKGFQDSLKLYNAMPAKQVKTVFMSMPDDTVVRYLRAMPPRTASKVIKEFKTPEEQDRINRLMERMRQGAPATQPSAQEPRDVAGANDVR